MGEILVEVFMVYCPHCDYKAFYYGGQCYCDHCEQPFVVIGDFETNPPRS